MIDMPSRRLFSLIRAMRAGIELERNDLSLVLHQLGKVRRLAAGRRAGIQHALSRLRGKHQADKLGGLVLHHEASLPVARKSADARRRNDFEPRG